MYTCKVSDRIEGMGGVRLAVDNVQRARERRTYAYGRIPDRHYEQRVSVGDGCEEAVWCARALRAMMGVGGRWESVTAGK